MSTIFLHNHLDAKNMNLPKMIPLHQSRHRFLFLILLAFAFLTHFLSAGTLDALTYEITGDTVTITGISTTDSGELVIPSLIEGKPVTKIGDYAAGYFSNRNSSIILPSSITTIGKGAFAYSTSLITCQLAEGLLEINDNAFDYCTNLKTLTIPSTVTHIGASAFVDCRSLESIGLPPGITTLSDHLFRGCNKLREITIPDQITSIGKGAFAHSGLESVTIPSKIKSLPRSAFEYCVVLRWVKLPSGMTEIGDSAFAYCIALTHINLSHGPKRIGNSAFKNTSLSNPQLDGVRIIGSNAFSIRNKIVTIRIPKSVKSIGNHAFFGSNQMVSAIFEGDAPLMGKRVFGPNSSLKTNDFTIFTEDGSTGFTVPRWHGYKLSRPNGEAAIHGIQEPYLLADVISTYKYGEILLGEISASRSFKLTNVGNRRLTSIRAKIKGGDASDYLIISPAKTSLAPGESTTVKIAFAPKKIGKRITTLILESSDTNESSVEIQLTGTGIQYL